MVSDFACDQTGQLLFYKQDRYYNLQFLCFCLHRPDLFCNTVGYIAASFGFTAYFFKIF